MLKITKKIISLVLSLIVAVPCVQAVHAENDNTMQIVFEDVTDGADTLAGEAKIKVSIKETGGDISAAQLKFNFTGNGSFQSIAYSDAINQLVKDSNGGQPFFIQPIDTKAANASKSFDIAFTGASKYSLPVSASGTEIAIITFSGEPNEEITLATVDLENSFCVMAPNIIEPKNYVAEDETITVKFSNTTNKGVKLTADIDLDELKESGGFADDTKVSIKLTNTANNQVRTFALSDAVKNDAASYKFETDKLPAGKYNIALTADGFVSKALENVNLTSDASVKITSDNFYAGDVNADGKLTLLDYNRFISMYNAKATAYDGIDYNRDGKLTQYDLIAFVTSAAKHMEKGAKGTTAATLTAATASSSVKTGDTFTVTLTLDAGENKVNSYYINATYPSKTATLTKAECVETGAENKAINVANDGKIQILNRVSDGTKKEIYTFTFKAEKSGTFRLSFDNAEGALLYDVSGDAQDNLLNVSATDLTVSVKSSSDEGGGGGGGGGGLPSGGGSSSDSGKSDSSSTENVKPAHSAYLSGYADNTVRPDNSLTRAEAAALISRISDGFSGSKTYDVSKFSDVDSDAWFAKNVGYAAENNIVSGYDDGTFQPNNTITREEFATMICRFMKYETNVSNLFSDVSADHWAAPYISAMKANGIIGGYEDGTFGLGKNITRAETISIINRVLGRVPNENKISAYINANGYPASDIKGHWAASQIIEAAVTHNYDVLH